MPEEYRRSDDPVAAYRAYYCGDEKRRLHAWRARKRPAWLENDGTDLAKRRRETL